MSAAVLQESIAAVMSAVLQRSVPTNQMPARLLNEVLKIQQLRSHPLIQSLFSAMPAIPGKDLLALLPMRVKEMDPKDLSGFLLHHLELGQRARAWIVNLLLGEQGIERADATVLHQIFKLLIAERIKQEGVAHLSRAMATLDTFRLALSEQHRAWNEAVSQNDVMGKRIQSLSQQPKQTEQLLQQLNKSQYFIQRTLSGELSTADKQALSTLMFGCAQQVAALFNCSINESSSDSFFPTSFSHHLSKPLFSVLSDASTGDWFTALSIAAAKADLLKSLGSTAQFGQLSRLWMTNLSCLLSGSAGMAEALDFSLLEQSAGLAFDGLLSIGRAKQSQLMKGQIGQRVVNGLQQCLPGQSLSDLGHNFWQMLDVINHPFNESSGNALARGQRFVGYFLEKSKALVGNAFAQEYAAVGQGQQSGSCVAPIVAAVARYCSQDCTNRLNALDDMTLGLGQRLFSWGQQANHISSLMGAHNTTGLYFLRLAYSLQLLESQSNRVHDQISTLLKRVTDDGLSSHLMKDVWIQLRSSLGESGHAAAIIEAVKSFSQRVVAVSPPTPKQAEQQQNAQHVVVLESAARLSAAFKQLEVRATRVLDKQDDSPGWSGRLLFALVDGALGQAGVKQLNCALGMRPLMAKLMLAAESTRQTVVQGQQPWEKACADLTEQCSHVLREAAVMLSPISQEPTQKPNAPAEEAPSLLCRIEKGSSAIQSGMTLLRKIAQWVDKNLPTFANQYGFIRQAMHWINSFEQLRESLPAPLELAIKSVYQDILETARLLDQRALNQEQAVSRILSVLKSIMTAAFNPLSERLPPGLLPLLQELGAERGISVETGFACIKQGLQAVLPVSAGSEKRLESSSSSPDTAGEGGGSPIPTVDKQPNVGIAIFAQQAHIPLIDNKLVCLGMQGLVAAGLMMQWPSSSSLLLKGNALLTQLEGLPEQELIYLSYLCVAVEMAAVLACIVALSTWGSIQKNRIRSVLPQNAVLANTAASLKNLGGGMAALTLALVVLPVVVAVSVFVLRVLPRVALQTRLFAAAVRNRQPRQACAVGKELVSVVAKGAGVATLAAVITALALAVLGTALVLTTLVKGAAWLKKQAGRRSGPGPAVPVLWEKGRSRITNLLNNHLPFFQPMLSKPPPPPSSELNQDQENQSSSKPLALPATRQTP